MMERKPCFRHIESQIYQLLISKLRPSEKRILRTCLPTILGNFNSTKLFAEDRSFFLLIERISGRFKILVVKTSTSTVTVEDVLQLVSNKAMMKV